MVLPAGRGAIASSAGLREIIPKALNRRGAPCQTWPTMGQDHLRQRPGKPLRVAWTQRRYDV
ncbi:hypothetical protein BGLA2_1700011 [Burkholderia gladioli]|nr:hypothetical protein BGLA2_1700011 [Burkholderia gladioli]